jgi:Arc/MetJ-type ribon-helix-helix transcriptional regulator
MAKTVKVTVSMPVEDVERLKALDAAGGIESVSGYVAQAVHDRLDRQAWLARWRSRVGDPDPEASAWADAMIDRHFGTAARSVS